MAREDALPVPFPADIRRQIEYAAQAARDTVDRLIALLDGMEENADDEAEPSLGAPENHHALQIVWLRGSSAVLPGGPVEQGACCAPGRQ